MKVISGMPKVRSINIRLGTEWKQSQNKKSEKTFSVKICRVDPATCPKFEIPGVTTQLEAGQGITIAAPFDELSLVC